MPLTLQDLSLKVVIMHARSGQPREIAVPTGSLLLAVAALVFIAGFAGVMAQRMGLFASAAPTGARALAASAAQALSPSAHANLDLNTPGATRDASYAQENVALLASRVGTLQAQAMALEITSRRLLSTALAQSGEIPNPGLASMKSLAQNQGPMGDETSGPVAGLAGIDFGTGAPAMLDTPRAEDIGRQLDALQRDLAQRQDLLGALDASWTHQSGERVRWPTAMPVSDYPYLSSSYGWRRNPVTGRHMMHEGLDFAAPRGTPIKSAAAGIVVEAKFVNGYGNLVEIDHGNGLLTRYAHAARLSVKQGDIVERGQAVAEVGSSGRSTGPHLHFEVRLAGQPLDPRLFLGDPPPPSGATLARAGYDAGLSP